MLLFGHPHTFKYLIKITSMKHLLTFLIVICSIFTKAQVHVLSDSSPIDAFDFCSSPKESLSIYIEESKTGPNWNYYFPNATGNTITSASADVLVRDVFFPHKA